jgi:hypothetical protein
VAALGQEVVFTKEEVRTFVAAGDMARLLQTIVEQLLASLQEYLGHPEFGARLIRKKYADQQRESALNS